MYHVFKGEPTDLRTVSEKYRGTAAFSVASPPWRATALGVRVLGGWRQKSSPQPARARAKIRLFRAAKMEISVQHSPGACHIAGRGIRPGWPSDGPAKSCRGEVMFSARNLAGTEYIAFTETEPGRQLLSARTHARGVPWRALLARQVESAGGG